MAYKCQKVIRRNKLAFAAAAAVTGALLIGIGGSSTFRRAADRAVTA